MSYKWKAGDWVTWGAGERMIVALTAAEVQCGRMRPYADSIDDWALKDCRPVIVRPKPIPKKIKRSELRAWFERQYKADLDSVWEHNEFKAYSMTCGEADDWYNGATLEAAILALRKALRKAGKFTP